MFKVGSESLNLRLKDLLGPVTRVKKKKKKVGSAILTAGHVCKGCSF